MSGSAPEQRAQAARLLHGVLEGGRTTDQVMTGSDPTPLTQELLLGSLRHYFSLARFVDRSLSRPLKPKDQILRSLLIVGAYQLRHARIPDHAALNETVNACSILGRPWARGLVNAVLRRCASTDTTHAEEDERSFDHPQWLERDLRDAYEDAETIMAANNQRAPMTLRINARRIDPEDYVARLTAHGMSTSSPAATGSPPPGSAAPLRLGPETRILAAPCRVDELPGFADGLVSVQDAGAQFAALLLSPDDGARVLDACAAPGGKLFHLAERHPAARLTALEINGDRLQRLEAEAGRLGHGDITMLNEDATELGWWDGEPYADVLIDAPCSGTGTLRRHPDIKVLRQPADVASMVALQERLLRNLWRVLMPGGTLLYCTCSILPAENDAVIGAFLAEQEDARMDPFRLATGRPTQYGWQLLPTDANTDGFYYARMTRATP